MSGLGQYADDIKCGKTMASGGLMPFGVPLNCFDYIFTPSLICYLIL